MVISISPPKVSWVVPGTMKQYQERLRSKRGSELEKKKKANVLDTRSDKGS